jgi:hypothetical protein
MRHAMRRRNGGVETRELPTCPSGNKQPSDAWHHLVSEQRLNHGALAAFGRLGAPVKLQLTVGSM